MNDDAIIAQLKAIESYLEESMHSVPTSVVLARNYALARTHVEEARFRVQEVMQRKVELRVAGLGA